MFCGFGALYLGSARLQVSRPIILAAGSIRKLPFFLIDSALPVGFRADSPFSLQAFDYKMDASHPISESDLHAKRLLSVVGYPALRKSHSSSIWMEKSASSEDL
jgi:hypothetical protein